MFVIEYDIQDNHDYVHFVFESFEKAVAMSGKLIEKAKTFEEKDSLYDPKRFKIEFVDGGGQQLKGDYEHDPDIGFKLIGREKIDNHDEVVDAVYVRKFNKI